MLQQSQKSRSSAPARGNSVPNPPISKIKSPRQAWVSALSREIHSCPEALVGSLTFNGLPADDWSSASGASFSKSELKVPE